MKRFLIFYIMSIVLYAFPTPSLSFMTWDIEKIADSVGDTMNTRSIALDENNNPGIAFYYTFAPRLVWYAQKIPAGTWIYANVDPILDSRQQGTDLQFNPLTGFPEISYSCRERIYGCPDGLKFAQFDGNLWNSNTINNEFIPYETSLAYHPTTNYPAIAYEAANGRIGFMEYNGSSWVGGRQGDLAYNGGSGFELKFLPNGNPLIAYRSTNEVISALLVAERVNADWEISTVDYAPIMSSWHALGLELNSYGLPHIAYIDGDSHHLRYASFNGISWNVEDTGIECRRVDFDFDSNDNPFFACEPNFGSIYFVYKIYNEWYMNQIEPDAYAMSNIVIDDLGNAHISFMRKDSESETDRNLYYAKGTPSPYVDSSFPWTIFYPAFTKSDR